MKEPKILTSKIETFSNVKNAHSNPKIKLISSNGIPIIVDRLIHLTICCKLGNLDHKLFNFFRFKIRYKIRYSSEKTNATEKAA